MINVTYNNWNKWYEKILTDFNFSRLDDEKSASVLNSLIDKKYEIINQHLSNLDKCIVFGAGPSLKRHIQLIKSQLDYKNYVLIAADGANTALLEEDIIPDVIVTDLDGDMDRIMESNQKGSILYVHAHGDNMDLIQKYVPSLKNIIPTTQSNVHDLLENYGGFTDGDRAVHIAVYALKMKTILLAGMDFGEYVTQYSRPNNKNLIEKADDFKKLKLHYGELLLKELIKNNPKIRFEFM